MEPIQKLDTILKHLASQFPLYQMYTDGEIFSPLKQKHPELDKQPDFGSELIAILNKLYKDGYIDIHFGMDQNAHVHNNLKKNRYFITFEGVYFIKNLDGYQGLDRQRAEKIQELAYRDARDESLATFQREQADRLNVLTRYVAWGALGLVVWEIARYFVFDHHWYLYCPK